MCPDTGGQRRWPDLHQPEWPQPAAGGHHPGQQGGYPGLVYGDCEWVSRNLIIRKESWQTKVSIIIIVVSASRLFLEVLELFQVVIDILLWSYLSNFFFYRTRSGTWRSTTWRVLPCVRHPGGGQHGQLQPGHRAEEALAVGARGLHPHSHLAQPPLPAQVRGINQCPEDNIVCHLFLRNVPFFGIYVVMFIDVSYTFMKVSVVVLLFIFSFSLRRRPNL